MEKKLNSQRNTSFLDRKEHRKNAKKPNFLVRESQNKQLKKDRVQSSQGLFVRVHLKDAPFGGEGRVPDGDKA